MRSQSGLSERERKQCTAEATARYKKNNPEKVRESSRIRKERNRGIVIEAKKAPCTDCGNPFPPICMDFDHREGEEKIFGYKGGVSALVNVGAAVETLQAEIEKCDLVCANCHRIRTAKKRGWDEVLYE